MKTLDISGGLQVLVDDADYDYLDQWKWTARISQYTSYARRNAGERGYVYMHRELLGATSAHMVDHRNGNGLDNRRENLRLASPSQNVCNKGKTARNQSGFKGVYWDKNRSKWAAMIAFKKKKYALGRFDTAQEAAIAYNGAAIRLHGDFAVTNDLIAN